MAIMGLSLSMLYVMGNEAMDPGLDGEDWDCGAGDDGGPFIVVLLILQDVLSERKGAIQTIRS